MRRREGILGLLSAIAGGAAVGKTTEATAAFVPFDIQQKCKAITAIITFDEFRSDVDAMTAYVHKDDPCHEVAIQHYLTLHDKPGYSHVG